MDATAPTPRGIDPLEPETVRRVAWRLVPLLVIGYFCSYLDRSNIGMAAPTMNPDLGFSNAVFGVGAGLFFWGYFLSEMPSNLVLNKIGARRWIARILLTWGIVSGLTAFVWSGTSFYVIRILLGLAEGGFFPGVVLYMTWWFPSYYRARMMAIFGSASVVSLFIGPPIGGLLLHMQGILGLTGWQWLFIMESLPPVIMSVVVWNLLTDRPAEATWLTPEQRNWLTERLASERAGREAIHKFRLGEACANPKIWLLTLTNFCQNVSGYALAFFMPLIVKGLGVSTDLIGVVTAIPYMCAFVAMLAWSYHSDLTGERPWHLAGACLLCGAGLAVASLVGGAGHPVLTMVALTFALMGQTSITPIFWSIPTALLTGTAAAGAWGMISAIANLGGFFGPSLFGIVKDATGSNYIALLSLALAPVIAAVAVLMVGHDRRLERIPQRS